MANNLKNHNYRGIDATVIADSKNEMGDKITSFIVTFPRMILAEFNTHRVFSRNSASSRAIPFKTLLKRVNENPFIPIAFQKEHKGMQGKEYLSGYKLKLARSLWISASKVAMLSARLLNKVPVTKQLCNRILEPFAWHTVIVTATEWDNYFELRDHEAAEIHIADLAHKMKIAQKNSSPKLLFGGEYHIPFGDNIDDESQINEILEEWAGDKETHNPTAHNFENLKIKIAIARCARISYGSFDGSNDYKKDIKLFERLSTMGHWSPFEHVAESMSKKNYKKYFRAIPDSDSKSHIKEYGWFRNFKGFIQIRGVLDKDKF